MRHPKPGARPHILENTCTLPLPVAAESAVAIGIWRIA